MRNWRELSEEEIEELEKMYPVTVNRDLVKIFDISVDAIQDHFARPRGWKKDMAVVRSSGRPITEAQEKYIIKHYPNTKNAEIMEKVGCGESTIHRVARRHGLKKTTQFLNKMKRYTLSEAYKTCLEYGVYEETRERMRETMLRQMEEGTHQGFKIGESTWKKMSKKKREERCRKMSESRKELIRKEKMRVKWGLEQKTGLRVVAGGRDRVCIRHRLKKRGYIVERCGNDVYYNEDTNRSLVMEQTAKKRGLKIMESA